MSTPELKSCPFCGGEAEFLSGAPGCHYVRCKQCKASCDDVAYDHAVALWNRRATPPSPVPDGWVMAPKELTDEMAASARRLVLEGEKEPTYSDLYRAMISAAPAAPNGWQDISSAPKDGTELLGLLGPKDIRLIWYFKPSSRSEGWLDARGNQVKPTHWQPLPAAPTSDPVEPEDDDTCTMCRGSGWFESMERYCDCEDGLTQRPAAPAEAAEPEPDWWWRDLEPDDSGDSPHEALSLVPDLCVCLLRSSYTGPTKFAFRAPRLDPDTDDTEVLLFDTEAEALAAAKTRAEQLATLAAPAEARDD